MSRRTSESNKAILAAWNREQELVQEGKGTREWTPQQQQDILEKGKAYDDNGKAFEGQHMKSAEAYPEFQGEPGNIQFLTRAEHLEAHDGNWQNPTNWYFNPVTKEKFDFGDGPFIPCEIIKLNEPVVNIEPTIQPSDGSVDKIEKEKNKENGNNKSALSDKNIKLDSSSNTTKTVVNPSVGKVLWDSAKKSAISAGKFLWKNKGKIALFAGIIAAGAIAEVITNSSSNSSYNPSSDNENDDDYLIDSNVDYSNYNIIDNSEPTGQTHSSPDEHTVRAHGQHYRKNGERVWIEKDSYKRGGKKD